MRRRRLLQGSRRWLIVGALAGVWLAAGLWSWRLPSPPFWDQPAAMVWVPIEPRIELQYAPGIDLAERSPRQGPAISAASAVLLEATTGTVLYAKQATQPRPPASTTKILTALIALERGRLDEVATVSAKAASLPGSSAGLRRGDRLTLEALLHGLLLRSGNDAAVAIAEHIAGSEAAFVRLMNERARELGARHSRFQNPHGLDAPGHFSSALDLALLARVALLYPKFAQIVGTREWPAPQGGLWYNTNRLLWSYAGAEGIKTGTTSGAGNCLVAAASRDGMQLVSVVLASGDRWRDSQALLDYGFTRFHLVKLARKGTPLAELPLAQAAQSLVAVPSADLAVVVPDADVNRLRTRLQLWPVKPPLRKWQTVGRFQVYVDDTPLREIPLIASQAVPRRNPLHVLWQWVRRAGTPTDPHQPSTP